jgi:hypothetical protein
MIRDTNRAIRLDASLDVPTKQVRLLELYISAAADITKGFCRSIPRRLKRDSAAP